MQEEDLLKEQKDKNRQTKVMAIILVLISLMVIGGLTFAWFTFNANTNVTPLTGNVTEGATEIVTSIEAIQLPDTLRLSISDKEEGPFSDTCTLTLMGDAGNLIPVSTSKLEKFCTSVAQNVQGISIAFKDVTDDIDSVSMHGNLYLLLENVSGNIFFDKDNLSFTGDKQTFAALRLGIKVKSASKDMVKIFKLDGLFDASGLEKTDTIGEENVVIDSISDKGKATLIKDPAEDIINYVKSGTPLFHMEKDEKAQVEYFLYLEGCDENCINIVQNKDIEFKISFTGEEDGQ